MEVAPLAYPAIQVAVFCGGGGLIEVILTTQISVWYTQPTVPENTKKVEFDPEPRRVTLDLPLKVIPLDRLKVPAGKSTTVFAGADVIAELIFAAVTLAGVLSAVHCVVAQRVVLLDIPPLTPALLQSIALEGSRMPDQSPAGNIRGLGICVISRLAIRI